MTREQLAEVSGFSQQYISGLEQGRRNLTIVTLYELAAALGVNHLLSRKLPATELQDKRNGSLRRINSHLSGRQQAAELDGLC